MRAETGGLTIRHLAVTVLVVVLVNSQLTWWIVFVLRENRVRLSLERGAIVSRCRAEADRINNQINEAHLKLDLAVASGRPVGDPAPEPFAGWSVHAATTDCGHHGWVEGAVTVSTPAADGQCIEARLPREWSQQLLTVSSDLEIGPSPDPGENRGPPSFALQSPFENRVIRPTSDAWDSVLRGYRGRILMMVSEGAFFAVLLFALVAFLWRILRREVALELEHRNFLSAVTHELKSPLASIRLAIETVLRGRSDSEASGHFLENALQDAGRLQDLVETVLQATRFTGRGGGLTRLECDFSALVEEAFNRFSQRTAPTKAVLTSEIEPGIPALADQEAMGIAISNLLDNALKYGGDPPTIHLRLFGDEDNAVFDITDNGDGIAPGKVDRVFDRFWRAGDEMTRTTNGTGLGLFLVRQIIEGHGGTVTVASTSPAGTTFRVILPRGAWSE